MRALGIALAAILMSASAWSATSGNSWDSRPAWASASEDIRASSPRKNYHESTNISPFAPGSNNMALDIGQVFLMGDLASAYTDSIGGQLHYTYGVSDMFGFDSSLGHSAHSDGKYSVTTLLTGLRMNLAWYDKVVPYLTFGLGFYNPSYDITPADAALENAKSVSLSPILFGLHAGPGVNLELTRQLFFGASLTFHDMFGTFKTGSDGVRREVGGAYTSFYLNAGFTF